MPALASPPNLGIPGQPACYAGSIAFYDVDGDGNGDIVIPFMNLAANPALPSPSTPNLLYIWYGNGDGTFGAPAIITLSRNYYLINSTDLNGDGLPELILSDGYLAAVLYNQGGRSFGSEHHLLAGQGINSISVADVNGDGLPDLIFANGGPAIANGVALGGKLASTNYLELGQNIDVNNGGITVVLNTSNTKPPVVSTNVSLALCVQSSAAYPCPANLSQTPPILTPIHMLYGQVLDGTASPNAADGSPLSPTGTVTFYQNGVAGNAAICTVPALPNSLCPAMVGTLIQAGSYTFTATFNGDATHAPSTSNPIVVTVGSDITTATLSASLDLSHLGQPVAFTATLTGSFAAPTGTVAFFDGTSQIGTATLAPTGATSGAAGLTSTATFTTSALALGNHSITAVFATSGYFAGSTSPAISHRHPRRLLSRPQQPQHRALDPQPHHHDGHAHQPRGLHRLARTRLRQPTPVRHLHLLPQPRPHDRQQRHHRLLLRRHQLHHRLHRSARTRHSAWPPLHPEPARSRASAPTVQPRRPRLQPQSQTTPPAPATCSPPRIPCPHLLRRQHRHSHSLRPTRNLHPPHHRNRKRHQTKPYIQPHPLHHPVGSPRMGFSCQAPKPIISLIQKEIELA
jgi:Bacterial Ig-like domain (group 3)/FG-GAP-like repeat